MLLQAFFDNNIKYTTGLLYDTSNTAFLNVVRDAGLKSSNFITWTGIGQSVPLKLRCNMPNLKIIFDLKNSKSCDYYLYLIKQKYEKPKKNWRKFKEEFNLEDKQVSRESLMNLIYAPFSLRFEIQFLYKQMLYFVK